MLALGFVTSVSYGAASGNEKVTLCHGSSGSWNSITVSMNAVSGHDGHSEDIIPAFTTVDNKGNVVNYPGKNLGADFGGQSGGDVLGNGCAAPELPPSELAHLAVIVKVVNNSGGTKGPSDFTVTASGNGRSARFAGQDDPGWQYTGEGGSYTVSESTDPGYTTSSSGCSGTLPTGGDATCVFTNDDRGGVEPIQPPIPPFQGPTGVTPTLPGKPVPPPTGVTPGVPTKPGKPVPPPTGVTPVVPTKPGQPVAPIAPVPPFGTLAELTVTVKVINDDGGSARPSSFAVLIGGVDVVDGPPNFAGSSSGTTRTVTPGSYAVRESTVQGYATSYSEGCSGSVDRGESASCAIVNNDIPPESPGQPGPPEPPGPNPPPPEPGQPRPPLAGLPATLTVITVVHGSKEPSEFVDLVAGTPVSGSPIFRGRARPGVTRRVRPGSYGVFQSKRLNYARTYSKGCSGSIRAGQHRVCVVVNREQRIPSGRIYDLVIESTEPPSVEPGGSVTWELVVSNFGPASARGVAVAQRLPAGFRLLAADGAGCRARSGVVVCGLGTVRRDVVRTLHLSARAPRTLGTAPMPAAVLGTALEITFQNNVARTLLRISRQTVCRPGYRLYGGTCHPVVAGQG